MKVLPSLNSLFRFGIFSNLYIKMLIFRTSSRHFSCVVGGDFYLYFHASLDIKIAKCTILRTGSDLSALFSSATQQLTICRSTGSAQTLQHLLAFLWNSNFCFH